jgi:hypothetical protein
MKLTEHQILEFQQKQIDAFVNLSIVFVQENFPVFAEGKTVGEIESFVKSLLGFCKENQIYGGLNVQKVIHYFILFNLTLPLGSALLNLIKNVDNEDAKVEQLFLVLSSGRYKLTEIEQL